jgi:hypothetical protein
MHVEHIAIRTMEPRDHDDLIARRDPEQCSREDRINVEPRVRRALADAFEAGREQRLNPAGRRPGGCALPGLKQRGGRRQL